MNKKSSSRFGASLPQLLPYIITQKRWLVLLAITAVLGGIMEVVYPFFLQRLTDTATSGKTEQFTILVYWAIFFMGFRVVLIYLRGQSATHYEALTIRDMRNAITRYIQHLSISYTDTLHTGDLVSRINNDVNRIAEMLKRFYEVISMPIVFILGFAYMVTISWKLLLAACILIPISGVLQNLVTKPMQNQSQKEMEEMGKANALTQDAIRGISIVKAFNLQDILTKKYQVISQNIQDAGTAIEKRSGLSTALFLALRYIPQLVIPLYGGFLAFRGEITVGALLASMTLIWMVFLPIEKGLEWLRIVRETTPAIDRIFELLNHPAEFSGSGTAEMETYRNGIPVSLEHIVFRYEGDEKSVLDDLSLHVKIGQSIGLVGPSGCGKSTVLKILCGFYEPQEGEVCLFGNPLFTSNIARLRKQVALVSQSTYLFPTTIGENIAYGRNGASIEEIIEAARAANAHDFIMEMPDGYDTQVGEWGAKLSGGEKQRITIARAILKNAPLLLLDEPTSALDTQSEALVQEALDRLMVGRTVIIVAHRLSTLNNVNEILVLDEGKIIERGSHKDLMAKNTLYHRLYQQQTITDESRTTEEMEVEHV